jgi:hypothetical protein
MSDELTHQIAELQRRSAAVASQTRFVVTRIRSRPACFAPAGNRARMPSRVSRGCCAALRAGILDTVLARAELHHPQIECSHL